MIGTVTGPGATTRRDALGLGAMMLAGTMAGLAAGGPVAAAITAATAPTAGRGEITALGWYVAFAHPTMLAAMEHHHAVTLGLPLYRRWRIAPGETQSKDHFWLGEAVLLDLSYQGKILSAPVRQAPVLRIDDVDAAVAGIRARGGTTTDPVDGVRGREAFVIDPAGQQIGLRETPARSPLAADREARRRALRGEAFNPGCASLPPGWHELGWVQLRAADPMRLAAFYRDTLGLRLIDRRAGSILLDLGDAVTLEIVGGGTVRPVPAAQYASTAAIILRARSLGMLAARLAAAGVPQVGKRYVTQQGSWLYIADPEGNVIGLSEWNHPSAYATKTAPVPIDLEAARRAAEARARRPRDTA